MLNFFKSLPNQPYHVRIQIFWVSVIVSILLVGWIWLGLLKKTVSINISKPVLGEVQEHSNYSLFKDLKNTLYSFSAEIGDFLKKKNSDKNETDNSAENNTEPYYQKSREVLKLPD